MSEQETVKKTEQEMAVEKILAAGWKFQYPDQEKDPSNQWFWDGFDNTCFYAWGAALKEIEKREQSGMLTGWMLDLLTPRFRKTPDYGKSCHYCKWCLQQEEHTGDSIAISFVCQKNTRKVYYNTCDIWEGK